MFLKALTISSESKVIREIEFHSGINLIVDESVGEITGNSVGKTTVLKLIDFCLGAKPKNIYVDPETKRQENKVVKDFLIDNQVLITLVLTHDLNDKNSAEITIERNFLSRTKIIRRINGEQYTEDEFDIKLSNLIFPNLHSEKPTFRQIISHNIRHQDQSINNTLKTIDAYTADVEYETLYLFMFGCEFTKGNRKQEILSKLTQEYNFKDRIEKNQTKSAYEVALSLIEHDIVKLNDRKTNFNLNENFEEDLDKLNNLKYDISTVSSIITKLNIRKNLILQSQKELNNSIAKIDTNQLKQIYIQASNNISGIQKTFEDLVQFHNQMIQEKVRFITKQLPELLEKIKTHKNNLADFLLKEKELTKLISKSESFEQLEALIVEMNEKYRKKGEFENVINQLKEVEENISKYYKDLKEIEDELFSESFEKTVKTQLDKFNIFFAAISNELYGEQYAIKYEITTNKKNQRLYKFDAFNTNFSSGKKQGEISCFDIAYTLFADQEHIPCLHFLLNDKKELMHDNQLVKIGEFVNKNNIQFVASILKDKLPKELDDEKYFVVKLSQSDKLFRIENSKL